MRNPEQLDALRVDGLAKRFAGGGGIDAVSMSVRPGSITGFIGVNGAGKSTTLRCVLGLLRPDAGEIALFGQSANTQTRRRVGFLPEERGLFPRDRAREAIAFHARLKGLGRREALRAADRLLERIGLGDRLRARIGELSKGNAQRVQILCALAHAPDLLLLDEPLSGLDPIAQSDILSLFAEFRAGGGAILFSTHSMSAAEALCDQVVILAGGRTVFEGPLDEVSAGAPHGAMVVTADDAGLIAAAAAVGGEAKPISSRLGGSGEATRWRVLLPRHVTHPALMRALAERAVPIFAFEPIKPDLEGAFWELATSAEAPPPEPRGVTPPIWLIAGREFRNYVATASFWVALAVGPVIMAGLLFITASSARTEPPASLDLTRNHSGAIEARFSEGFPLSAAGRDQVLKVLRQDGRPAGRPRGVTEVSGPAIDAGAITRFELLMMLWMTLTGSLGMLLQAVVRERVNRALESLLAATSAWNIVCGKLIGVGAVSLLVVGAWLGSSSLLAIVAPHADKLATVLLQGFAQPAVLARAGVIYLAAFAFYGLTTVAIGARARDNADAQNLARPMFGVLLAVFFTALALAGGGAHNLAWLVFIPPFTPFVLLTQPQGPGVELAAMSVLAAATACAAWLAVRAVTLDANASSNRQMRPVQSKV